MKKEYEMYEQSFKIKPINWSSYKAIVPLTVIGTIALVDITGVGNYFREVLGIAKTDRELSRIEKRIDSFGAKQETQMTTITQILEKNNIAVSKQLNDIKQEQNRIANNLFLLRVEEKQLEDKVKNMEEKKRDVKE